MRVFRFLKSCNEELVIVVALAVFFLMPHLLRQIDPTAGAYDAGVLQVISVAVIAFCVFKSFTWFILRVIWPSIPILFRKPIYIRL